MEKNQKAKQVMEHMAHNLFYVLSIENFQTVYFTTTFTNFFLPRFTTSPSAPKEAAL